MAETIADRLGRLGIVLPALAAPVANYLPWSLQGDLLFVSGQLPLSEGKVAVRGKLGESVSVEDGRRAARLCAVNILAQAQAALGDLERVRAIVRIGVFVASVPDFVEQHVVANGASDLLVEVLGDAGRHARAAVGMSALPLDAAVEVEAVIAVAP
ncbi:RidA family protein [Faunimonas sp. B44]|uniref:RidA family protein n=1 Tax=Faunimonas sp. B44 TaxID=3461493 RepID=UPI00404469A0